MKLREVISKSLRKKILLEGQVDNLLNEFKKSATMQFEKALSIFSELSNVDDHISEYAINKAASDIRREFEQILSRINDYVGDIKRLSLISGSESTLNSWKMYLAKILINYMRVLTGASYRRLIKYINDHYIGMEFPTEVKNIIQQIDNISKKNQSKINPNLHDYNINILMSYSMFEHFSGIDYAPIQNYNPLVQLNNGKSIIQIKNELIELEKEYKSKVTNMERYIPITGDEDWLLEIGEYRWLNHNDWCSKVDGKAMRHCGNTPYNRKNDRVYTLNSIEEIEGTKYRKPHLFFVLEEGGILGERKGYGNSKPESKYYDAIVEFIKLPIVKLMKRDSRHEADNDFQLDDLSESQINEILNTKDKVFILSYKYGNNDQIDIAEELEIAKEDFFVILNSIDKYSTDEYNERLKIAALTLFINIHEVDKQWGDENSDIFYSLNLPPDTLSNLVSDNVMSEHMAIHLMATPEYVKMYYNTVYTDNQITVNSDDNTYTVNTLMRYVIENVFSNDQGITDANIILKGEHFEETEFEIEFNENDLGKFENVDDIVDLRKVNNIITNRLELIFADAYDDVINLFPNLESYEVEEIFKEMANIINMNEEAFINLVNEHSNNQFNLFTTKYDKNDLDDDLLDITNAIENAYKKAVYHNFNKRARRDLRAALKKAGILDYDYEKSTMLVNYKYVARKIVQNQSYITDNDTLANTPVELVTFELNENIDEIVPDHKIFRKYLEKILA